MKITEHFDSKEFACKCCGTYNINNDFVVHLEEYYRFLDNVIGISSIIINSGYRCNNSSKTIKGAFIGDCHNLGIGADIHVYTKEYDLVPAKTLAECAEVCQFKGIGIIDDYNIHLDERGTKNYTNNLWFGNEATGETYNTFIGMSDITSKIQAAKDVYTKSIKSNLTGLPETLVINGVKYKMV